MHEMNERTNGARSVSLRDNNDNNRNRHLSFLPAACLKLTPDILYRTSDSEAGLSRAEQLSSSTSLIIFTTHSPSLMSPQNPILHRCTVAECSYVSNSNAPHTFFEPEIYLLEKSHLEP